MNKPIAALEAPTRTVSAAKTGLGGVTLPPVAGAGKMTPDRAFCGRNQ